MHISVRFVVSELGCDHLGAAGFVAGREGGTWRGYGRGVEVGEGGGAVRLAARSSA